VRFGVVDRRQERTAAADSARTQCDLLFGMLLLQGLRQLDPAIAQASSFS
jgi:hypothetical protein